MVTIEEAKSQLEARKQEVAVARRGIQVQQIALPETRTQRVLRAIKGIAGVPARQRVEAAREELAGQKSVVEQYGEQLESYEKQIAGAGAGTVSYEAQRAAYGKQHHEVAEWKQAEELIQRKGGYPRYDPTTPVGRKIKYLLRGYNLPPEVIAWQKRQVPEISVAPEPSVAYKDIFTGEIEYVSKDTPSPYQVPIMVSPEGRELGPTEQLRLQAERPELFARPLPTAPSRLPSVIPKLPTGVIPRLSTGVIPRLPRLTKEQIVAGAIAAPAMIGREMAAVIPDYGPGIKVVEARVEPAKEFVEKPAWVPEFGTYVPPKDRIKEYRPTPELRYAPKYIFGAKRVKEAVRFGVPLGIELAAMQYVPKSLIAPVIVGAAAVPTVKATKEITELKGQKIGVSEIEKEIGKKPVDVSSSDWGKYRSEYIAEIERYNKEIETAIKTQRRYQALGATAMAVGVVVGGRQLVRYAKKPLIKVLPYKVPKPIGTELQVKVVSPVTGNVVTVGKYKILQKIPARKAAVQKRWEKWIGREPKIVEVTKPKVKYRWTPDPIIGERPGLVYETRAVKPETLKKFLVGKRDLFVKPQIVGGRSAPITLAQFKKLPKYQQEMWRRLATEFQGGTPASFERTPAILKKYQTQISTPVTYEPLADVGKRITRVEAVTAVEPITTITKPTEFGLMIKKIPKKASVELFRAETIMKGMKATGASPRAIGKMPGLEMKIIRLKKVIGIEKPSKTWGITPAVIKKTPFTKTFQVAKMGAPIPLPKPPISRMRIPSPKVIAAPIKPSAITKVAVPSIWAGKGMYERTGVGARLVPGVALDVSMIPREEIKEISRLKMDIFPVQRLRPTLKPILKPALKPVLRLALKPNLKPALKPALKVIVKPTLKPALKVIVKPIIKPMILTPRSPRPPSPPRIPTPIIKPKIKPKLKRLRRVIVKPKPRVGYEVEVKTKGEWTEVSPFALSKGEALALGRKETKAGAEVTFRLKKTRGEVGTLGLRPVSEAELKAEYRGRMVKGKEIKTPLVFIQKRKARIATPGEFAAITAKGIAKRKGQAGDIKW